ncbi:hypothetical protein ACVNS2_20530 [Paenibacillus caseinilyticus]|uniref:Uncharacterized protein n=1 Tax=Paenibacillus mucilaginosus K02 TaxID=997761 RepID=I0BKZ8_9BACL|nr:hypothetical protein [Paenibacillus mucilaginosus]AFH63045.2 hypothetical protein B2K_20450 [Paenibacillus mucilaginosus K02]
MRILPAISIVQLLNDTIQGIIPAILPMKVWMADQPTDRTDGDAPDAGRL